MSAQRLIAVSQFAEQLAAARKGEKGRIVEAACATLGMQRATFYRALEEVTVSNRKRRADAGEVELPRAEAAAISAYIMEGYRKNAKKTVTIAQAVDVLRANGKIVAGRVDETTGEIIPLSISAISRALRAYTLHPEQLKQPSPHVKLKSAHPNHVWQVDGSVCVLFYLPGGGAELVETDQAAHYKNKPENLKAIERFRVIRYVLTDHCTGLTRFRYYPHAETGEHTVRFLAWAMAGKPDPRKDPFEGRPRILMVDPGATSGGLVKRFCRRMEIELIVNERRRPRAKGSVEKGNDIVELAFESGLRFARRQVADFADLNALAEMYQIHWNNHAVLGRHGMTRMAAWMHIRAEHLVRVGAESTLLALATDEPLARKVTGNLTVSFQRRTWYVGDVPGVLVGGTVHVHWHPFVANTAMAVVEDEQGREVHYQLPDVTGNVDPYNNEWGFQADAALIGEERKSRPDTLADTHRKEIARIASGRDRQADADKARERKDYVPFGNEVDPYLRAKTEPTPDYLPKRGTEHETAVPKFEFTPLSIPQLVKRLKPELEARGIAWTSQSYAWLERRYPDGAQEDAIEGILAQLTAAAESVKPGLRAV